MTAPGAWASRIVGEGEVDPATLEAHPGNHRTHPRRQVAALARVMGDIGWVQRVVVNRRTGRIVDGHARVALAVRQRQATVPVVWVDLDDDAERTALATYDAIGGLASVDPQAWQAHVAALPGAAGILDAVAPWRPATVRDDAPVTLLPLASHVGAYALHGRAAFDPEAFKAWKVTGDPALSTRMVDDLVRAWRARANHVDVVTMPPPSRARGRDYATHPMWGVVEAVGAAIGVAAVPFWAPREAWGGRGRGRSKVTLAPLEWLDGAPGAARTVLVLDDAVTTRATHVQVRDALNARGIASLFIAWASFGH